MMSRSGCVRCSTRSKRRSSTIARRAASGSGAARWPLSQSNLLSAWQGDRQLEDLVTILALQVHLDRFGVDVHIFLDDFKELTTQQRQVVRAATRAALLGDDDA